MVLTFGGIGFAVWRASTTHPKKTTKTNSVTSTPTLAGESSLSVGNNNGLGAGVEGQAQSLGQQSDQSQSNKTEQSKTEDFTQYEKYKDAKSALFGEIKAGTGNEVKAKSKVSIYYVGKLTSGIVFDQSRAEKEGEQPKSFDFTIGANQVIPGMEQGLVGMKAGGTRRIIIPPAVGYGDKGYGPVPANAVMIFDVQLLTSN